MAVHGFLETLERVHELEERVFKNPNHVDNDKHKTKAMRLEKALQEAKGSLEALSQLCEKNRHKEETFHSLENAKNGAAGITLNELDLRFKKALSRARYDKEEILGGWTLQELFRRVDKDHSGSISLDEWTNAALAEQNNWSKEDSLQAIRNTRSTEKYDQARIDGLLDDWDNRGERQKDGSKEVAEKAPKKKQTEEAPKEAPEGEKKKDETDQDKVRPEMRDKAISKMLKAQFKRWDKDNDGLMSKSELSAFLTSLNPCLTSKEVNKLFDHIDENKDGTIQFEEFVNYIFSPDATIPGSTIC